MTATLANTLNIGRRGVTLRAVLGVGISIAVTLTLFWIMSFMIEMAGQDIDEGPSLGRLDFVRVKKDEDITRKRPPIVERDLPEPPPAPPAQPSFDDPRVKLVPVGIPDVSTDGGLGPSDPFGAGIGAGDYLPIVKVAPVYPQRALSRGTEGFCVVEYTVTRQGTVRGPRVIESQCTSPLFHRVCVEAAVKFKYRPRVIDGRPVEVSGVQNRFTFEIED